jgi:hypothetical protein
MQGSYWYCDTSHILENYISKVYDQASCQDYGGDWLIMDSNYDDIISGLNTLFNVALTEGWIELM